MTVIKICLLMLTVLTSTWLSAAPTNKVAGYVMDIHMTPAKCLIETKISKQRKCLEGYSLHVEGLYPLLLDSQAHCQTTSSANLPLLQAKVVAKIIPDERERIQMWRSVGGCVNMTASQYFRTIIKYADQLKMPFDLSRAYTEQVKIADLQNSFLKLNPQLISEAIYFDCQKHQGMSYLTEVKVCYHSNGKYRKCPNSIQSRCPNTVMIKGTY